MSHSLRRTVFNQMTCYCRGNTVKPTSTQAADKVKGKGKGVEVGEDENGDGEEEDEEEDDEMDEDDDDDDDEEVSRVGLPSCFAFN